MCTGAELAIGATLLGLNLFGKKEQQQAAPAYTPPPAVAPPDPAAAAPTARAGNAVVRVGDKNIKKASGDNAAEYEGFVERRLSGKALGGLGRGGLGL